MGLASAFYGSSIVGTPPTVIGFNGNPAITYSISQVAGVGALQVASGALTADTYPGTAQVALTGSGVLGYLAAQSFDSTARTITVKIVIDGTTVIEKSVATTVASEGIELAGNVTISSNIGITLGLIPFRESCDIYVKSSVTETDKTTISYVYRGN